jgi:chromosome partitioning protein
MDIAATDVGSNSALKAMLPQTHRTKEARVILCSSAKGGTGKSTTVRSLASFAAKEGFRVATIDLDAQQTLSKWWGHRPESLPPITNYDQVPPEEAGTAVVEIAASGDHDIVFVDTAPGVEHLSSQLKTILMRSDLVLVPTTDGAEDLIAVSDWMKVVRSEGRPAWYLLCRVDKALGMFGEAKRFLGKQGRGNLCAHEVRTMQAIRRSFIDGRGPADFVGKAGQRAAEDYELVWIFVKRQLGMED